MSLKRSWYKNYFLLKLFVFGIFSTLKNHTHTHTNRNTNTENQLENYEWKNLHPVLKNVMKYKTLNYLSVY